MSKRKTPAKRRVYHNSMQEQLIATLLLLGFSKPEEPYNNCGYQQMRLMANQAGPESWGCVVVNIHKRRSYVECRGQFNKFAPPNKNKEHYWTGGHDEQRCILLGLVSKYRSMYG